MGGLFSLRKKPPPGKRGKSRRKTPSLQPAQRGKAEENNANLKGPPPGWRKKKSANTQWEIHQHLKKALSKFRCFQFEIQAGDDDDDQDQEETNCIPLD